MRQMLKEDARFVEFAEPENIEALWRRWYHQGGRKLTDDSPITTRCSIFKRKADDWYPVMEELQPVVGMIFIDEGQVARHCFNRSNQFTMVIIDGIFVSTAASIIIKLELQLQRFISLGRASFQYWISELTTYRVVTMHKGNV